MQKVFFVFSAVLFVFSLSSCEKNLNNLDSLAQQISAADKTDVDVATLPTAITDFTEENYFETYIDKASLADALGYELSMGNEEIAFFSLTGEYLDEVPRGRRGHPCGPKGHKGKGDKGMCGESIDVAETPQAILDYVTANYPDNEIKKVKLKDEQYIVKLTGHLLLIFDNDESFVEELTPIHNGPCGGTPVAYEDLSTTITDYITANYGSAEFKKAKQKDDGRFVVMLLDGEDRIILIFDEDGTFIEEKM